MKLTESTLKRIIREELSRLTEAVEPGFFQSVAAEMVRHPDVKVKKSQYAEPGPGSSGSPTVYFEVLDQRGEWTATFRDRRTRREKKVKIEVGGPMHREKLTFRQSDDPSRIVDYIVSSAKGGS